MALFASQVCVAPRQREVGFIMIEGNIVPFGGLVACGAICSEFAAVLVILLVAGITVHRCAFVYIINMALLALDIDV